MPYVAGTNLTFEIPVVDASGEPVDATAVEFSVADGAGNILMGFASLAGYVTGSDAAVTVPAEHNALAEGNVREPREITLRCVTGAGVTMVTYVYLLEAQTGALVRGVNSLVTLGTAEMLASEIPDLSAWPSANNKAKTAALLAAYKRLGRLQVAGIPWGHSILDLSAGEVLALDQKLYAALSYAQVAEADAIMAGDTDQQRNEGLVLETIGEVKKMFRSVKPVSTPVSKRALSYLGRYVSVAERVIWRA